MKKSFIRRDSARYLKLGKLRKKARKWRKPTGRDNKMRLKLSGYPKVVQLGYRTEKSGRDKINGKMPKVVNNINDLLKIEKNEIALIGKVGKKKKLEIAKKANEKKIEFANFNFKRFLKEAERKSSSKPKPKENAK